MCCMRLAENTGCKNRHLRTITQLCRAISLQLRHISTIGKKLLNNISTWPHNMVNFRPLTAEIHSEVWGTSANFNGFRVLALLLHWRRSTERSTKLCTVWPSPGLVHYIYIFWGLLPPNGILPAAEFTLNPIKSCILLYLQHYCTALAQ